MIAVSQCPSSTSFASSKETSYYSYTAKAMQQSHYTILPQPIQHDKEMRSKISIDCQRLLVNELPAKPTLSVIPSTREKTNSDEPYEYHHKNEIGQNHSTSNFSICPAPLDLTCHKSNDAEFGHSNPSESIIDCPNSANDQLVKSNIIAESETENNKSFHTTINYLKVDSHFDEEMIRRQKRREQNKAAAQSYRLRKKSVTELIETEHEIALKRNKQLMAYRTTLESEISRMRSLLKDIAMTSKQKEEEKLIPLTKPLVKPMIKSNSDQASMQCEALDYSRPSVPIACSNMNSARRYNRLATFDTSYSTSPSSNSDSRSSSSDPSSPNTHDIAFIGSWTNSIEIRSIPQLSIKDDEVPAMRPRQNTWPMDGPSSHVNQLTGKNRKKEQNRLASRRFRVRRKMEMSENEVQLNILEKRNHKLRRVCDDYSKKIEVIKEVLEKLGCSIPDKTKFS